MRKIAVITGAGADVRRATALEFAQHGWDVALSSRDPARLDSLAAEIGALGCRALPIPTDVAGAGAGAVDAAADRVETELGPIDVWVNVAMATVFAPAADLTAAEVLHATPQFDWALNKTGHMAKPVPPIYQPEVPARAILFAANNARREIWVGFSTVKAILGNRVAPGLLDRYLASAGYTGQLAQRALPADAPDNLFSSVPGHDTSHGRFDDDARTWSPEMFTDRHKDAVYAGLAAVALAAVGAIVSRRRHSRGTRWLQLAHR